MSQERDRLIAHVDVLGSFDRDDGGQTRVALRNHVEASGNVTPYLEIARLDRAGGTRGVVAIKREELSRLRDLVARAKALLLGAEEVSDAEHARALVGLASPRDRKRRRA